MCCVDLEHVQKFSRAYFLSKYRSCKVRQVPQFIFCNSSALELSFFVNVHLCQINNECNYTGAVQSFPSVPQEVSSQSSPPKSLVLVTSTQTESLMPLKARLLTLLVKWEKMDPSSGILIR